MKESPRLNAEQEIQHLLDAMPFYAMLVDNRHNILAANMAVKLDFGLSSETRLDGYCPLAIHDYRLPISECPLVEACAKGRSVEREIFSSQTGRWMKLGIYPTSLTTTDGRPVFMHFARNTTEARNTAAELSRSLEHHSALCDLLQNLQHCQSTAQILDVLIDQIISLSWLGLASTAVGFLVKDQELKMAAQRNLSPWQLKSCEHLALGDCLCGKVAQSGHHIICSSSSAEHTIQFEEMEEHAHVVMPISHEARVLGVLALYLKNGDEVDASQLDFLKAATTAAGAALAGQLARENAKRIREKSIARIVSYQEEERKRIAMGLHDQVCQSLSALLLQMQTHGSQHESLRAIQQDCELRVRTLIDEVRRMAVELRPTILDDYGLEPALGRHIEELSAAHTELTIDYEFASSMQPENRLPSPIEVGLYRVVMEALSNVITHASATRASVVILWQPAKVMLLVEDDGCGFDYAGTRKDIDRCLGLIDMEERIGVLGGTIRWESTSQKGTAVRAEIPLEIIN